MRKSFFWLIFLVTIFIGCNDKSNHPLSKSVEGSPGYDMEEVVMEDVSSRTPVQNPNVHPQKIIKTGFFTFETKSVDDTYKKIKTWVETHNGFIQNDNTSKDYNRINRSLLIRIPSRSFQPLVDSIYSSVKSLDRKEIRLKDVSEEFVDLEARLKAKRKLEERYLQLLSKANTVKDMLAIERQIAQIREEIEAKQGRLNYLQSKVSLSSIHLDFYEMTETTKAPSQTYMSRLWRAVKGGFTGIGEFIIGALYLWPFLIVMGVIVYFIRRRIRKPKN